LKFLVIAALFALFLLLVYSKIYPYIRTLKKILGTARTIVDVSPDASRASASSTKKSDQRLVRCVGCGTWIPADRAIGSKVGASIYCSRECLEKPAVKERKAAS
jgi:hypothetical protein